VKILVGLSASQLALKTISTELKKEIREIAKHVKGYLVANMLERALRR